VPQKSEIQRKIKEELREEIRRKLSPPLDPVEVSASGQGPPVLGMHLVVRVLWGWPHTARGWALSFYTLWVPVSASQKFSKLSQWVVAEGCVCMWGCSCRLTVQSNLPPPQMQVLNFLA